MFEGHRRICTRQKQQHILGEYGGVVPGEKVRGVDLVDDSLARPGSSIRQVSTGHTAALCARILGEFVLCMLHRTLGHWRNTREVVHVTSYHRIDVKSALSQAYSTKHSGNRGVCTRHIALYTRVVGESVPGCDERLVLHQLFC
eukprot:2944778-Rhodomonas_salina.3